MNLQNSRTVNFRFSDYISEGYKLYRDNFGAIVMASLCMFIMSLIPFCSLLAFGNFSKFMKRLKDGQSPDPSEVFNFDDFTPYFKLFLILIGIIFVIELPLFVIIYGFSNEMENPSPLFFICYIGYMLFLFAAVYILMAKAFYMPYLISIKKITDIQEAWRTSSQLGTSNILIIIGFILVTSMLAQLGIFLCLIGIVLTLPFHYAAMYVAAEDGVRQAEGQNPQNIEYFK